MLGMYVQSWVTEGIKMAGDYQGMDAFAVGLTRWMIKLRLLVILAALAGTYYVGTNVTKLEFSNNYRAFFSPDNPELQTFEDFQAMYTKSDNFLFVLEPRDGSGAFTNNMLDAVEYMTEQAWLIPYALRVDSLSNFQYTYAIEDDLIVEDLYSGGANLSEEEIETVRQRAFSEPLVFGALVDPDGRSTAINVTLQLPRKIVNGSPRSGRRWQSVARRNRREIPQYRCASLRGINAQQCVFRGGANRLNIIDPSDVYRRPDCDMGQRPIVLRDSLHPGDCHSVHDHRNGFRRIHWH